MDTETGLPRRNQSPATETQKTLGAIIAGDIRARILSGEIDPGEPLRFEQLKKEYDASISPLRDALSQLVADGLVVAEGQRGYKVAALSIEDITDITLLRKTLESLALRQSIDRGAVEWEANLVRAFHVMSRIAADAKQKKYDPRVDGPSDELETAHREFHEALLSGSKSPKLIAFCKQLWSQADRYRRFSFQHASQERNVMAEHQAIVDAALARDTATAGQLLEEHIERSSHAAIEVLTARER